MDKYHASKYQKERAKLRGELYADMRDHMKMMRGPGGMMSATVLALIVIPAIYAVVKGYMIQRKTA